MLVSSQDIPRDVRSPDVQYDLGHRYLPLPLKVNFALETDLVVNYNTVKKNSLN